LGGEGKSQLEAIYETLVDAEHLGPIDCIEYQSIIALHLREAAPEPHFAAHPQLMMLTPEEARMQTFDRVILGALNAEYWPGMLKHSPWLNTAQLQALGLSTEQDKSILSAHDALMFASHPHVVITYSGRLRNSPAAPSPYLERLLAYFEAKGFSAESLDAPHYRVWADALFVAEHFAPSSPVAPCPPTHERPRTLNVSQLDDLFRDPYRIYARSVLGLEALDALDSDPDASDYGQMAHALIAAYVAAWNEAGSAPSPEINARLIDQVIARINHQPLLKPFWHQRLNETLHFIEPLELARRNEGYTVTPEKTLAEVITLAGDLQLELRGRIDRLEQRDGMHRIVDYKTGTAPTHTDLKSGKVTQLFAYALMLQNQSLNLESIEYWQLPSRSKPGGVTALDANEDEFSAVLAALTQALIEMYAETTPFLSNPLNERSRFTDSAYADLSRFDEWGS
jgi:ATP-dependent helicase/nuclease subunit B